MSDNEIKLYAYYDTVAKTYDRLFPAKNDLVAQRIGKGVCANLYKQDKLLCNDLELHYIGVFNLETGLISENKAHQVLVFKDFVLTDLESKPVPDSTKTEVMKNA